MEYENDKRKKECLLVERNRLMKPNKLQVSSKFLMQNDTISPHFDGENVVMDWNPNSVENKIDYTQKKKHSKLRKQSFSISCTVYEKKLLQLKAKSCRLSVSEYCRRAVFKAEIKERLTDRHIDVYKTLVEFHNNLRSTGNRLDESDPKLTIGVYRLANEIKVLIKNIIK